MCDALCVDRRARGLPGLSMQWGPVANVGYVAETMKVPREQHSLWFCLRPLPEASLHAHGCRRYHKVTCAAAQSHRGAREDAANWKKGR